MKVRPAWLLLFSILTIGCGGNSHSPKPMEPVAAPNFELKDLSGKNVNLSDYRGRPIMLDFWATWCGPCRISMPVVQDLYTRYEKEGFVVLGMNMDETTNSIPDFVKKYKITYPILLAGESNISQRYGMEGIPLFIFIDRQGRVVDRYDGFSFEYKEAWQRVVEQLLTDPA